MTRIELRRQMAIGALVVAALVGAALLARRQGAQESPGLSVRQRPGKEGRYEATFEVMGTDGRLEA
ncbi:MAG: hypothetical protein ACYS8K_08005 [Planctomycetota bacterium]|jgi:hypothetical protein